MIDDYWNWVTPTAEKRSNLPFIRRVLLAINENRRVRAIKERHAREAASEFHRELLLFLDDCKFHGLDWDNPEQRLPIAMAWAEKQGHDVSGEINSITHPEEDDDDDGMERDHEEMCR
jgi:hypothetical protein